jgi:glucose/arabinose dehydrogenase
MTQENTMQRQRSCPALRPFGWLAALALLMVGCGGGGSGDGEIAIADVTIALERAFPNVSFHRPVALLQAPTDVDRWFVVEQGGRVLVFDNDPQVSQTSVFIDIRDRVDDGPTEAGLLGMAFHPDFANNRQVFLSYTRTGDPLVSSVSRFTSSDGGKTLDAASETVILTLEQPFGNHNGGGIGFGPDGLLYLGFGDGGSGGDPQGNGQNTDTLLGAILRIDVDQAPPYTIPSDNPFAQGGGRGEIYAWGLRNPWRWSFDRVTGELWVGDVGQNQWEEIDRVERGGNYGWNVREGAHCFNAETCDTTGLIDPVAEYAHSQGCSVTGGYVYRGLAVPDLQGVYLYGDFCSGRIWGLPSGKAGASASRVLLDSDIAISSFGEGLDGEVYALDHRGGALFRLVAGE